MMTTARQDSGTLLAPARAEAEGILSAARREAGRILSLAQEESDRVLSLARNEAEHILTSARDEAERTLTSARSEVEQIVTSVREESERTVQSARERAQGILSAAYREQERWQKDGRVVRPAEEEVQALLEDGPIWRSEEGGPASAHPSASTAAPRTGESNGHRGAPSHAGTEDLDLSIDFPDVDLIDPFGESG